MPARRLACLFVAGAAASLVSACSGGSASPSTDGTVAATWTAGLPSPSASSSAVASASASAGSPSPAAAVGSLPGEPDPHLTPGATNPAVTQATIGSTICVAGWTATIRPPSSYTTALKREQIAGYGYADATLADYEEDHLIPLELGGAPSDPHNLWPEPYAVTLPDGTPDGARVKDQLENELRALVCAGSLPLATAQQAIATDWVRAWMTYVRGSSALPAPVGSWPTPTPVASEMPVATGATSGGLAVTIASLTSPVSPGARATLAAETAAGAACSIVVVYKSGPSSASGLGSATADAQGHVSWTWTVGSRTSAGSWPVTVTCYSGPATASATTTLVVL